MPDNNLQKAYDSAKVHYDLPDFTTFQADMQDPTKLSKFHDNLAKFYSVPDIETFTKDIGVTPVQSNSHYILDRSNEFLRDVQSKLTKNSNLDTKVDFAKQTQDLGNQVENASKYYDINTVGLGIDVTLDKAGKKLYSLTDPIFNREQLEQEINKISDRINQAKIMSTHLKLTEADMSDPMERMQYKKDNALQAKEAEDATNSLTSLLSLVKGKLAQDFSITGVKDKSGTKILDPLKPSDLQDPIESKQKIDISTKFLKDANTQPDNDLVNQLMFNAVKTTYAGDPNGENRAMASIKLHTMEEDGDWIKQSPVDLQRHVYDYASFEKKSVRALLEYKDKPVLANINEQLDQFNKLLADKTKKLSDDGYAQYQELVDLKKSFENKISEEQKYIGKLDNIIQTKVPDLQKYEAHQEYLNKVYDAYPITTTIATALGKEAKGLFSTFIGKKIPLLATNAITNDFNLPLDNGNKYSYHKAAYESLYGNDQYNQEPQAVRDGKYINLSELDAIKMRTGKLIPHVDPTGLLFQTAKTALDSGVLGITGIGGLELESGLFGDAIIANTFKNEALKATEAGIGDFALNYASRGGLEIGAYLTGTTVGFVAPSVLLFGPDMIKQELDKGLSYNQSVGLGSLRAGIEGLTERLFIDNILDVKKLLADGSINTMEQLAENKLFKAGVEGVIEKYTSKEAAPYLFKFLYKTDKEALKLGVKEFAKILGGETLEEEVGLVLNHFATKLAQEKFNKDYKDTDPLTMENVINTALQTMATMLPQGAGGFYTHYKEQNNQRVYSQYQVGMTPTIFNSTIDNLVEKGLITDVEATRRKNLVNHYKEIYDSNEEQYKLIDTLPISEAAKENKKFELFKNELKQSGIDATLATTIDASEKEIEEIQKEQETIKTDEEIINEPVEETSKGYEQETLDALSKQLSPKSISEIKDIKHIDDLLSTLDEQKGVLNTTKDFKDKIDEFKTELQNRKIKLQDEEKTTENLDSVKSITEEKLSRDPKEAESYLSGILSDSNISREHKKAVLEYWTSIQDKFKPEDQSQKDLKEFRKLVDKGIEKIVSYKGSNYNIEGFSNGNAILSDETGNSITVPIDELYRPLTTFKESDVATLAQKFSEGDQAVIDKAATDLVLGNAIKEFLQSKTTTIEVPEDVTKIEKEMLPSIPASVLRSIGANKSNLFLQGSKELDVAYKVAINSLKTIINDQTQDKYKVLVLRPSELVEKLGGLEAIKDILTNDYEYWSKNGYGDESNVVKMVLTNQDGEIVYFNERGVEGGQYPSVHNLPTEARAKKEYKEGEPGFKRPNLEEKPDDLDIYNKSLSDLEAIRKNPPKGPVNITKINLGLVTRFSKKSINTSGFINNLVSKFNANNFDPLNLQLEITTTPQIGRVTGTSYLVEGKYNFSFPISRPKLSEVQIPGMISALVEIGTRNFDNSRTLDTFEGRKKELDKFLFLDNQSVDFGKSKYGEYFLVHQSFFDGYPVKNIVGIKKVGDFYYMNVSDTPTEEFKTALEHVLEQKTLNITPQLEGEFKVPIFSDGKLSYNTYDSYQTFVEQNSNIYQEVIDNKESETFSNNGVEGFPGSYLMIESPDVIEKPIVKEEKKTVPKTVKKDRHSVLERSKLLQSKFSNKEWEEIKEWWKDSPLSDFIDLNHFTNIINDRAHATFFNNVITLYNTATPSDLFHEAWHGFEELFLTPKQREALDNKIKSKTGTIEVIENGKLINKKYSDLDERQLKEVKAEGFQDYAASDGKILFNNDLSTKTIFQKVWDFIKNMADLLQARFIGNYSLENLYSKLYKGNINDFTPSMDNSLFGKLDKTFTADGVTIGSVEVNNFIDLIDSSVVHTLEGDDEHASKAHVLFTADEKTKIKNFKNLYTYAKEDIAARLEDGDLSDENREKLKFLYDNFDGPLGFEKIYLENSTIFGNIKAEEEKKIDNEENNIAGDTDEINEEAQVTRDSMVDFGEKNKKSAIKQASNEVIYLISTLSREGKVDKYGFPKLLPLQTTWYRLSTQIKGITDPEQIYQKIDELGTKYPEYKQLLKRLPSLEGEELDVRQINLLQSFIQAFSKPLIEMYEGVMDNTGQQLNFYNTKAATKAIDKLAKKFSTGFRNLELEDNSYIFKNKLGENVLNISKIKTTFGKEEQGIFKLVKDVDKRIEFLNAIGIELSPITLDSKQFKDILKDTSIDRINLVFDALANKLGKEDYDIKNPIQDIKGTIALRKEFNYQGESKSIDAILQAEIDAVNEYEEDLAINPNNDNVYQIQQFSKTSLLYTDLNNKEKYPTLQDLLKEPEYEFLSAPNLKYSLWLNSLFKIRDNQGDIITSKEYGKRRNSNIELRNVGGLRTKTDRYSEGGKTTDLFSLDKIFYDINSFFFNNVVEHMRYGDKGSSFGTEITYSTNNSKYPVTLSQFKGTVIPKQVIHIFEDYFKGVVDEIIQYNSLKKVKESTGIGIAKYDKTGGDFRIFENLLSKEVKDDIRKQIDEGKTSDQIKVSLKEPLETFFNKRTAILKNKIRTGLSTKGNFLGEELGIKDTKGLTYNEALNAFIISNFIYNYEQMTLINGDVSQFKAADDIHKRLSADSATGDFSIMNKYVKYFLNTTGRIQEFILTGKKSHITNIFKSIVLNDITLKSQYLNTYLDAVLKNNEIDLDAATLTEMSIEDGEKLIKEKAPSKSFNAINVLKAFSEVNETDALGLCTLDFYRNFKVAIGQWNDLAEKAYNRVARGEELLPNEIYYFVPIKAQYSGNIANTKEMLGQYVRVDAFDKFALIPMIPTAVQGKGLETLSNKMIKENVGYAIFESGSKKAALTKDGKFNDINSTEPFLTNDKFFRSLKEQVYIEPKVKPNIIFATQFNKLFNIDLFSYGQPKSEKINSIADQFNKTRQKLVNIELAKVKKDLGITNTDSPINFAKLSKILKKEFKSRDLPDNIQDFIRTDENGELVFSLDSSLSRQKITSVILSIINNRIIKSKLNGDNYIQTAFTGWKTDDNLKIYELKENENGEKYVTKMQAKVSISKFKNLLNLEWDGHIIQDIKELNKLLKNEEFVKANEDKLTLVGVRIPVQGANSMLNLIVEEFLPETTGSVIVLPSEITAIAGSDFDIDKVSMYTPNFNENGSLPSSNTNELKKQTSKALDLFPTFTRMGIKEILDTADTKEERDRQIKDFIISEYESLGELKDKGNKTRIYAELKAFIPIIDEVLTHFPKTNAKASLQNEMIKLLSEAMSQPEMFESLFTPNSTSILKPLADDIKKETSNKEKVNYTTVFDYNTQIDQFEANLIGKKSLGIAAKNNTFNQLFKQHNVYLNQSYKSGLKSIPVKVFLQHNTIEVNGKKHISLGGEYDANNEYKISEIISQFINGFVDVAKDPWVFDLGATFEATPTLLYLNHIGVPIRESIYLVNQPIIKEYLNLKKMKNFQVGKLLSTFYDKFNDKEIRKILTNKFKSSERIDLNKYNVTNKDIYSEDNLLKNIKRFKSGDITKSFNIQQQAVLQHFIELENQASNLRELSSALDFDTSKINSIFAAFEKEQLYEQVLTTNMFNKEGVEGIKKNSVISMLDMNSFVKENFPKMFKVIELKEVNDFLLDKIDDASKGNKEKFESRFKNDLIGYTYNAFTTNYSTLRPQFNGEMLNRLNDIIKEFPEAINQYSILKQLSGDQGKIRSNIINLKTKSDIRETKDINNYIEEFKKGIVDDSPKIREFFKDLISFSFVQSGLQKSPISFTHLLPTEEISKDIEEALPLIEEIVKNSSALEDWYRRYFVPNNNQVIKPKVLKRMGYLSNDGHSYNDEAYRLKEPIIINANETVESLDIPTIEVDEDIIGEENTENDINSDNIPDDIGLDILENETKISSENDIKKDDILPELNDCE